MPELPEVETIRQSLLPHVLEKTITDCQVKVSRVLPLNDIDQFSLRLIGEKILDIRRRGKYLLFALESGYWMIVHLRMTGKLILLSSPDDFPEKHVSVVFAFADGSYLLLVDQRKFGTIYLLNESELDRVAGLRTLGPEPLSDQFSLSYLSHVAASNSKIKAILLDQRRIAGIGNIYADEALFRARIHPARSASSLTPEEIEKLHGAIRGVLTEAIEHNGTTIRDYRTGYNQSGQFQNFLRVYGKEGRPCPECTHPLERMRVAGRSSHFCPQCQKEDVS